MQEQMPPELGTLLHVAPVVQTERRGQWTLTLVSVERWDRCFVANVELVQSGPVDLTIERLHPSLRLGVTDGRGKRFDDWFGGQYGGGLVGGGERHRVIRTFTPPLDLTAHDLRFTAQLQLVLQEDRPSRIVVARVEPERWTFAVALPAAA